MKSKKRLYTLLLYLLIIIYIISVIIESYNIIIQPKYNSKYTNDSFLKKDAKDLRNAFILAKFNFNPKETIFIGNLEIAKKDLVNCMTWDSAMLISQQIGDSWRLPNVSELDLLFKNRKLIGGFTVAKYWSSDIHTERITAYEQYFNYQGFKDVSPYSSKLKVRFVRTVKSK